MVAMQLGATVIGSSQDTSPIVGNTAIRSEILRGSPLRRTLRNAGYIWRTSPLDVPEDRRERLWRLSEPCMVLHIFFSHAWKTPGWQKYMALLAKHCMFRAWAFAILTLVILIALDLASRRSGPSVGMCTYSPRPFGLWEPGVATSLWTVTVPPALMLIALFADPYLPWGVDPLIFLDATCINQVDSDLKREGINALAGFLANSNELHILWSPPWSQRKWCVFELAAYIAVKGDASIKFYPIFMGCCYLGLTALAAIACGLAAIATCLGENNTHVQWAVFPLAGAVMVASIHYVRNDVRELKQLDEQLANFDVNAAECRDNADSDFIAQSIEHWYTSEDAFNRVVRVRLRERIMICVKETVVSYNSLLYVCFPMLSYGAAIVAAHSEINWQAQQLLDFAAIQAGDAFFVCPLFLRYLFAMCWRAGHNPMGSIERRSSSVEVMVCLFIALAGGLFLISSRMCAVMLHSMVPFGGSVYFGIAAVSCWLAFRCHGR